MLRKLAAKTRYKWCHNEIDFLPHIGSCRRRCHRPWLLVGPDERAGFCIIGRIDFKIIAQLQQEGRLSNQELSNRVALSPSPCLRRVRQLEEAGVIKGYTAAVDHEACNLPIMAFITIRLDKQTHATIQGFEDGIAELDEVMACYLMSGGSDYMLHVLNHSFREYETYIRERLTRIPEIVTLETHLAFGQVKQKRVFPSLEKS